MKDCPLCGATMFPRQTTCPSCGAQEQVRRGSIGWGLLIGGALLLAGGLVICFVQFGVTSLAQVTIGLGMVLYGMRFRQITWVAAKPADHGKAHSTE